MANDAQVLDVIIVGGGAAGLTAGIFATRRGLSTLIISQDIGGQAATTPHIENYPGMGMIHGRDLSTLFREQAEKFGAVVKIDEVRKVEKADEGLFHVLTARNQFTSRAVILAYGLSHKHMNVPGEDALIGHGVSYSAYADAEKFRGKTVAVVGGGNSAMDSALLLSNVAAKVYLICLGECPVGEATLAQKVVAAETVELTPFSNVVEIAGTEHVEALVVARADDPTKVQRLAVDGVFPEIGYVVKPDLVKGLLELDKRNQIVISKDCETSVPGIFAAGDVTTISFKQVVISAGEGAKAALKAFEYIQKSQGKPAVFIDWGAKKK